MVRIKFWANLTKGFRPLQYSGFCLNTIGQSHTSLQTLKRLKILTTILCLYIYDRRCNRDKTIPASLTPKALRLLSPQVAITRRIFSITGAWVPYTGPPSTIGAPIISDLGSPSQIASSEGSSLDFRASSISPYADFAHQPQIKDYACIHLMASTMGGQWLQPDAVQTLIRASLSSPQRGFSLVGQKMWKICNNIRWRISQLNSISPRLGRSPSYLGTLGFGAPCSAN